jgi:hypothetical protein
LKPRSFRRIRERELSRINLEFFSLVRGFEESLFGLDWDSSDELNRFPIFEKYNDIWLKFCRHWKENSESRIIDPDPLAFFRYAIDKDFSNPLTYEETREETDEDLDEEIPGR